MGAQASSQSSGQQRVGSQVLSTGCSQGNITGKLEQLTKGLKVCIKPVSNLRSSWEERGVVRTQEDSTEKGSTMEIMVHELAVLCNRCNIENQTTVLLTNIG